MMKLYIYEVIKLRNKWVKNVSVLSCTFIFTLSFTVVSMARTWKLENNFWKLYNEKNEEVSGWVFENNQWYLFDKNTKIMKTGWYQNEDGTWYFFDTRKGANEGTLLKGWNWIDGYSYFFDTRKGANEGALFINRETLDGYMVGANGQWGWIQILNRYIYLEKEYVQKKIIQAKP